MFLKNFFDFLDFLSFVPLLLSNDKVFPIKRPSVFFKSYYQYFFNLDDAFSCYLRSLMTLIVFVLTNCQWIFQRWYYIILFHPTFGVAAVITAGNPIPVSLKILNAMVLCIIKGFLSLVLRILNSLFLSIIPHFMS